jgi:hypothetical protein
MRQAGVIAAPGEDRLDARLFAEGPKLTDELALQSRLGGDLLGVLPQLLTQGLGPAGQLNKRTLW